MVDSIHAEKAAARGWLLAAVVGAIVLVVFLPALRCDFVSLDDGDLVYTNTHVYEGLTLHGVQWAFSNLAQGFYFPLTWLSLQLDAQLYGLDAWGYHLTNVLLHACNTMLLFAFLRLATGSSWRSMATAAVFAVHPLRVESVAWITERKDVLCAFFGFLSLIAYVHYARRPTWRRYALVFAFYVLCLLCKMMMATLPAIFLILDFWPLERWGNATDSHMSDKTRSGAPAALGRLVAEKIVLLVPTAIVGAISVFGLRQTRAFGSERLAASARIANALVSYWRYIGKTLWFSNLAVQYPLQPVSLLSAATAAVGLVWVTVLVLRNGRRWRWLAAGWFWYLIGLLPMAGLPVIAWADRFSYFPCIGLLLMLFWSLPEPRSLSPWKSAFGVSLVVTLFLILCTATRAQLAVWENSRTLWERVLQVAPTANAHAALGDALLLEQRPAEAVPHFRIALRRSPSDSNLVLSLAVALQQSGDSSGAIELYRFAVGITPHQKGLYFNLATELAKVGLLADAVANFGEALKIDRNYSAARWGRAAALREAGKSNESAEDYREGLRLDPTSPEGHAGFGRLLLSEGNAKEATRHFAEAVRLKPDSAAAHNELGTALLEQRDLTEAGLEFERALRLDPACEAARINLQRIATIPHALDKAP